MSKLRHILVLFVVVLLGPALLAQSVGGFDPDDLNQIRIDNVDKAGIVLLNKMKVDISNVQGNTVWAYVMTDRLAMLKSRGFQVTIIPDPVKLNPNLRAGYHTHSELTSELQAIAAANPSICHLYNIGDSHQGRELWFMKISDNVDVEENEPEFKYISTMHGDEPVGMELCMNLINLLVDDYGTDPQITNLVDNVEIWIMPLMNPDGYTSHSRYNSQGRDLNRDFPDRVSDPNNTTTGRGTETKHVMNWAFAHSSVLSANFHGGALVVNYPYDSDPNPWANYSATPDDALFIQQSLAYSTLNGPMYNSSQFNQGITNGVAWYAIYGGMQDWNYVWMGCNEVTIELGNNKWPNYSQIAGLWSNNRDSMLAYMELCLEGVRGLVTDSNNGLPVDATVRVTGIDHDVFTDPDVGDYYRMLLPGTYSLQFSADGYITQTVSGISVGSGAATVVDVSLVPEGGGNDPVPDLKVNGSDGPITILPSQNLTVTVTLDPGNQSGTRMDWWLFVDTPMGLYSYRAGSGNWIPGASPVRSYNGALFNVPSTTVFSMSGLSSGTYDFTWAVDALNNTYEGTYEDTARVTVQ